MMNQYADLCDLLLILLLLMTSPTWNPLVDHSPLGCNAGESRSSTMNHTGQLLTYGCKLYAAIRQPIPRFLRMTIRSTPTRTRYRYRTRKHFSCITTSLDDCRYLGTIRSLGEKISLPSLYTPSCIDLGASFDLD
jgi:hypothetical protein